MSRLRWVVGNAAVVAALVGATLMVLQRPRGTTRGADMVPPQPAEPRAEEPSPAPERQRGRFPDLARRFCWFLGNFLIVASVVGAVVVLLPLGPLVRSAVSSGNLAAGPALASMPTVEALQPTPDPTKQPAVVAQPTLASQPTAQPTPRPTAPPTAMPVPIPTPEPRLPITRIVLPRIKLETEVVPSKLVDKDGVLTWDVPAFKAGHADTTVGPGQVGTAIIFGHVVTLHSGNVFENLHTARVGDDIQVFSGDREFLYRVTDVSAVPRDDTSILEPSSVPTIALITCTGAWNPVVWDYMERLIVRADLVPPTP